MSTVNKENTFADDRSETQSRRPMSGVSKKGKV